MPILKSSAASSWLFYLLFVSHSDASAEATHIISAISEVPSVPAPCDTEGAAAKGWVSNFLMVIFNLLLAHYCFVCHVCVPGECKDCESPAEGHTSEAAPVVKEALKERPAEEVTAILAQQEKEETDVLTCRLQTHSTRFSSSNEPSSCAKPSPFKKKW